MKRCTGLTASWCPVHGDCTCPRVPFGEGLSNEGDWVNGQDDPSCPLHSPNSSHPELGGDWELDRPHEILRAVCIRYLDGRKPGMRYVVIDDSAPPGGVEVLYREQAAK